MDIDATLIERAAEVLRKGGLVAFPTETVYGLGADASNPEAVARIFSAKGRPADHPLIVHVADATALDRWAVGIPLEARVLARAFWPGPLTLVLEKAPGVPDITTGGRSTVGLRAPDQPIAQALLNAFGGGIAAPSANRFGRVSPTCADDVRGELGDRIDLILDGGSCEVGIESTIVDTTCTPFQILRPGGISADALEAVLGVPVARIASGEARAPGMLEAHYAPAARVLLATSADDAHRLAREGRRVGFIGLEEAAVPAGSVALGSASTPEAYAHDLYRWLRDADAQGLDLVVAVPPPPAGIGVGVIDRLKRAAASTP